MMNSKTRFFTIDWILHLLIGAVIPVLSMLSNIIPNDWRLGIIIFVLSIPWEGYIVLLDNPKDKIEQICLRSTFFNIVVGVLIFSGCGYLIMRTPVTTYSFYFWFYWLLSIAGTLKYRTDLRKYIDIIK